MAETPAARADGVIDGSWVPDEWVKAAESCYSMHGAGLIRNIISGVAPLIAAAERARVEAMDHSAFLRSAAAALYSDRARIREGAADLAFTLSPPGNGNGKAHASSMDVVPLAELLALIGGEDG